MTEAGSGIALHLLPLIAPCSQWLRGCGLSCSLPYKLSACSSITGVPAARGGVFGVVTSPLHSHITPELGGGYKTSPSCPWDMQSSCAAPCPGSGGPGPTEPVCTCTWLWCQDVLESLSSELPGAHAAPLATSELDSVSSTAAWAAAIPHHSKDEVLCSTQPHPCSPTFPPGWPTLLEAWHGAHAQWAAAESGTAWRVTIQGRLCRYAATAQLLYVKPVERATDSAMHQAQPQRHSALT